MCNFRYRTLHSSVARACITPWWWCGFPYYFPWSYTFPSDSYEFSASSEFTLCAYRLQESLAKLEKGENFCARIKSLKMFPEKELKKKVAKVALGHHFPPRKKKREFKPNSGYNSFLKMTSKRPHLKNSMRRKTRNKNFSNWQLKIYNCKNAKNLKLKK